MTVVDSSESSAIATLFPAIARSLGLNNGQLGLLAASGKLIAMPFGFGWVWLAGRTSRRVALSVATILGGVFGFVGGFSTSFVELLWANSLMAACVVGAAPLAHAIIGDSFADSQRSRAVGYYFAATTVGASLVGPGLAQLAGFQDGWRYGLGLIGAISVVGGVAVLVLLRDPGIGASEPVLLERVQAARQDVPVSARSILAILKVPTFALLMVSRLMSGHLLITVFGVQFLVQEHGFPNGAAALVFVPYGVGYGVGAVTGGWVVAALDRRWPDHGRVAVLQAAQLTFASAAFFGTQFDYGRLAVYGGWCAVLGLTQAFNPAANRPLVMSVIPPEVRGQAFAIFLSVVDSLAWVWLTVLTGRLGDLYSLRVAFFWLLVVLMIINGVWLGLMHLTYARDRDNVIAELARRRNADCSPLASEEV